MLKDIKWLGRSREMVCGFAKEARAEIGYQLYRLQQGLMPLDYKPMATIGRGVWEIRVHKPHEHRVIYVTKFKDRTYVLHAFEKKTKKTSGKDIEIAKKRYQELINRINSLRLERG